MPDEYSPNRDNLEVHSGNFIHDLTDHLPNYLLLINKKKIIMQKNEDPL